MIELLKKAGWLGAFACACVSLNAQIPVTSEGKPVSRIIVATESEPSRQAARLLQDFVERISGASLPILDPGAKDRPNDIIIGESTREAGSIASQWLS